MVMIWFGPGTALEGGLVQSERIIAKPAECPQPDSPLPHPKLASARPADKGMSLKVR
jgi:hypothetical protein